MGGLVDAIGDFLEDLYDEVKNFVEQVWDEVVMPILEEVFSWFGIEDETIVEAQRISSKIYETATSDMYQEAIVRAVLAMPKNDAGFFRNYMQQVYGIKGQMLSWYRDGEIESYFAGLPNMVVKGGNIDTAAVEDAVDAELGTSPQKIVLSTDSSVVTDPWIWYAWVLQEDPFRQYIPWSNTMTANNPNGTAEPGWAWDNVSYDAIDDNYDITISKLFEETKFWIEGPETIREEDVGSYTIRCNRNVVGQPVQVNLVYSGTAVDGTDYNSVASVTIPVGSNSVPLNITTLDNISGNPTLTIGIDTIVDPAPSFEYRSIVPGKQEVTTVIKDNDGILLTIDDVFVAETAGTAVVTIKLWGAAAGSFTVTASTQNGTAVGLLDFTPTSQFLLFNGTANETLTMNVPILTDAEGEFAEYFEVYLSGCSDPAVDTSQTGKVWITDLVEGDPLPNDILVEEIFTQANYVPEAHLIVKYHDTGTPDTEWFYWLYRLADGTYTGIEPFSQQISDMDMMPIAILRKDKQSITSIWKDVHTVNPATGITLHQQYNSTRRLVDRLGLSLQTIIDNMEANPDIGSVDDAYIHFSVSPIDTHKYVSKILYMQWKVIVIDYAIQSNQNEYRATIEEGDIQNAMVWSDHGYTLANVGTVCPVGEYIHSVVTDTEPAEEEGDPDVEFKKLILQHQTAPGLYDEIYISRLNSAAFVKYQQHHTMAINSLDGVDTNFTIPISWFVLNQLKIEEIVTLYPYMLRMDMHAIQIIELEWYETSAFWNLFTFVAIVVTIVTAGAAGGILAAIQQLAINYLIIELVIWVAEETGNEILAAIVGIVAAIALGYMGAMPALDFSSATDLVELSTNFANNLTVAYETEMVAIGEDLQELNRAAEARLDEIQEAMDNTKSPIDTEWLVTLQSQASSMYMALDAQYDFEQIYSYDRLISNYHDQKLRVGVI